MYQLCIIKYKNIVQEVGGEICVYSYLFLL